MVLLTVRYGINNSALWYCYQCVIVLLTVRYGITNSALWYY